MNVLSEDPRDHGVERTRWRLQDLIGRVPITAQSVSGLWTALRRLDIRYRAGWAHLLSPDPLAQDKLAWLEAVLQRARAQPERVVVLWLDELTFYRLPSMAPTWSDAANRQRAQKAGMSAGANTCARVVGALNAFTGQLHVLLRSEIGSTQLQHFYLLLRTAYPHADEIYVIQDCWPVHLLTPVCATAAHHNIALLPLPTYSSWRNPIEKLWRWLKQDVIHMHRWALDWPRLKQAVLAFLAQFDHPSPALLRYVGLSD